MELQFIGCGSAFTTREFYQSNVLITKNEKRFLIDVGGDARHALEELGLYASACVLFIVLYAGFRILMPLIWRLISPKNIEESLDSRLALKSIKRKARPTQNGEDR